VARQDNDLQSNQADEFIDPVDQSGALGLSKSPMRSSSFFERQFHRHNPPATLFQDTGFGVLIRINCWAALARDEYIGFEVSHGPT
jgi:hypothetical protein